MPLNPETLTLFDSMSHSGPGNNGHENVLHIPQRCKTEASSSDVLVSYPGHSLVGSYSPKRLGYWMNMRDGI